MKKIVFLAIIGLMGVVVMAGAPANNTQTQTTASLTVDSQWTTTWIVADSMILIKTDSCETFYHATATVFIKPGQKLYYGIRDGITNAAPVDTFILQLSADADSAETVQIGVFYHDSLISATDARDSIMFMVAVGGSSKAERVAMTNIRLTGAVFPRNN